MARTLSNIRVEPCSVTWNSVEVGYTEGDIEITLEEQSVDITTHQTGSLVLDSIRTGVSASVSVTFKETSVAQLQTLLEVAGGTQTPGAGTKVSGWGTTQQFTGQFGDSQKLVLHPITATDESKDICFWKAYPIPGSITVSSENPTTVSVEFKIFNDSSQADEFSLFCIGDHTQTFA